MITQKAKSDVSKATNSTRLCWIRWLEEYLLRLIAKDHWFVDASFTEKGKKWNKAFVHNFFVLCEWNFRCLTQVKLERFHCPWMSMITTLELDTCLKEQGNCCIPEIWQTSMMKYTITSRQRQYWGNRDSQWNTLAESTYPQAPETGEEKKMQPQLAIVKISY